MGVGARICGPTSQCPHLLLTSGPKEKGDRARGLRRAAGEVVRSGLVHTRRTPGARARNSHHRHHRPCDPPPPTCDCGDAGSPRDPEPRGGQGQTCRVQTRVPKGPGAAHPLLVARAVEAGRRDAVAAAAAASK